MVLYTNEGIFLTSKEREDIANNLDKIAISFEYMSNPLTEAIEAFRNFSLVTASALDDITDNQNKKGDLEIFKGKPIEVDKPVFRVRRINQWESHVKK